MNDLPIILVVDDVAANRETIHALLREENYRFVDAADGAQALALAAECPPDLVLLDVLMPGLSGFEVCRRLRADARLCDVPVIMVTMLADRASRISGIEAGVDGFVSKPYDRVELVARAHRATRLNRHLRVIEQQSRFQWVVEQAPEGYVLVNAADEIIFANARARLWLALPPHKDGAKRETFAAAASRGYVGQPSEARAGWPLGAPAESAVPRLLVRPETPQARAFFLEATVHENTDARLIRLRDVTERITTRRDQRSFQAAVQHKLRTPLNAILGPLKELATNPASLPPADVSALIAVAHAGAVRLNGAVQDVLRSAEVSQCPQSAATFALDGLGQLVSEVADGLDLAFVRVEVSDEATSWRLPCSRETLAWVLFELLENARKFHPQRAPTVVVRAAGAGEGWTVLTTADDGLVLSPEQLAQAGRPFFQGEKYFTGETPGMGLGLANVFALVLQSGGSCRVRNRTAGPGVCVDLLWPREGDASAPGTRHPAVPAPEGWPASENGPAGNGLGPLPSAKPERALP